MIIAWPLIAIAITEDEVGYYNSPTQFTALVAATGASEAPKRHLETFQAQKTQSALYQNTEGILGRIAACESQGNLYAKNPRSTAKGKYQFLDSSWKHYGMQLWGTLEGKSVFSEKDQDELAAYVVSINGFRDWNASAHCWK